MSTVDQEVATTATPCGRRSDSHEDGRATLQRLATLTHVGGYMPELTGSQSLAQMLEIFKANFRDINLMLHRFGDAEYVFQVRETGRFVEDDVLFSTRLAQWLFNYLSSLAALVDHTRNTIQASALAVDRREEYDRRVQKNFRDSPRASFLKQLRNYMLHDRLPTTIARWDETGEGSDDISNSDVMLELGSMTQWDGWSPASRAFMESEGSRTRLLPLVSRYADAVFALYGWLLPELEASEIV